MPGLWNNCSEGKLALVLAFAIPTCFLIGKWFTGEAPVTISIEPSVVLVGDQVTLSCQLMGSFPTNTNVLWYKRETGRDAPLCSSSSLGGTVQQCQGEGWCRAVGHWQRRAFLLVIPQVQVADEGMYVCAVNSSGVTQEGAARLHVTAMGYKPTLDRDQQEESLCRYTCKSKRWYPKPEVIWMNYGGDTLNVEAKTNVTWSERDHFTLQSIITVPCDRVDVVCVVKLTKANVQRSGSMNEIIVPQSDTCTYKGRIRGSYVKPKVMWVNPQGEDLSSLAQTSILQEVDNTFAIESSIEMPCGQPPPSFVTVEREHHPQIAQQSGSGTLSWFIICLLVLIVLSERSWWQIEHFQSQHRAARDAATESQEQIENQKKEIENQKKEIEFRKARGHADDIRLNEDTAHPALSVAVDKKSFIHKAPAQKAIPDIRSSDSLFCVLGSEGFSSGKHYWEVEVEKSDGWDLGVARKPALRKGIRDLSPKDGFWAVGLSFKVYWARTEPTMAIVVKKHPRKVGIYLDCEENTLTVFNVTDMSVMFTFSDCALSEGVYPFFSNSHKGSTMRICSVKEE
ncbi:butyrophilin subfamily 1 member A1-like isoform X3 [Strigops habroptila]|uniref:butyrophilin subfamily 1 member A1-like isoform X3 n=1 Tax=Strigops habroptila TaxID=2489341 RepID=UPI0011CEE074|nr:butyrophilin subfamily 1 member A1-like isoform X3 [Strigops habroptila]